VQLRAIVKPDRRFLGAVAEVAAMLAASRPSILTASWTKDQWVLRLDDKPIGGLSPLPSFGEVLALLRHQASELTPVDPRHSGTGPQTDASFASLDLFSTEPTGALHRADQQWRGGRRDPENLDMAGRASVALVVQSIDRVGVTDLLYSRALALLAIRQALTQRPYLEDAAALASLMGYDSEAIDLAKRLPSNSAVRLFVTHQSRRLREVAEQREATASTRFLFLLQFGEQARPAEWTTWVHGFAGPTRAGVPLYRAAMNLRQFGPDRTYAALLLCAIAAQAFDANTRWFTTALLDSPSPQRLDEMLSVLGSAQSASARGILQRFEDAVAARVPMDGVLAGGEAERAWYRSFFYSALYGLGTSELDRRASAPGALAFVELLDNAGTGAAPDFRRWFLDLARAKNDQQTIEALIRDIGTLPWLGHPAIQRSADDVLRALPWSDARRHQAARAYVARIDTRAAGRRGMARICSVEWVDMKCHETYRVSYGRMTNEKGAAGDPDYAQYLGDRTALAHIVDDQDLPLSSRVSALQILSRNAWLEESQVAEKYHRLYRAETPSSIFPSYMRYLESHGRLKEAEAVARERIAREGDETGLERAFNARMLAENLEKQGRHDEAWQVIEPWIETWRSDVMRVGASILESQGLHTQARDLSRRNLHRYPGGLTQSGLAQILWRQGRHTEVPPLFSDPKHPPGPSEWRSRIAPDFAEIFEERPVEDAQRAFAPLVQARVNRWYLVEFGAAMAKAKRYDVAFALLSDLTRMRPWSGQGTLDPNLNLYRYLREFRGEAAALAWTEAGVTDNVRDRVIEGAFNQREFALFWRLMPEPGRISDRTWVLQAAAVTLRPDVEPSRREAVMRHFQEAPGPAGDYGRYLLGLTDEAPVFRAAAASPLLRGDAAYVLGLRALADGRYEDASDWFLACRELDAVSSWGYQGAEAVLTHWGKNAHPLSTFAQQRLY
jgi:hypothetical protein